LRKSEKIEYKKTFEEVKKKMSIEKKRVKKIRIGIIPQVASREYIRLALD
jgi:hypothetical protein